MAFTFDAQSSLGQSSGATLQWSHTSAGDLLVVVLDVCVFGGSYVTVDSADFNGDALTQVPGARIDDASQGVNQSLLMFYLLAPDAGTFNITFNFNAGTPPTGSAGSAASYISAQQTGQPDSVGTPVVSSSPITASTTTVADLSLLVAGFHSFSAAPSVTSGGTTRATANGTFSDVALGDNTGITPAGSASMTANDGFGGAGNLAVIASFAPASGDVLFGQAVM